MGNERERGKKGREIVGNERESGREERARELGKRKRELERGGCRLVDRTQQFP